MRDMTKKCLEEAFAGESMAHMKYLAFSAKAEQQGYSNVARMFKAIAFAEQVHATNHARNLGYIDDTVENLQAGFNGENFEIEEMYPAYMAVAELQDEKGAQKSIHYAVEAEKIHRSYYEQAQEKVKAGKDIDGEAIYICPVCGYTHIGDDLDALCPVCSTPKEKYHKF